MLGPIFSMIVAVVIAAVVLMIVDRFNVGLKVGTFMNAVIAAIDIAIVGGVVGWILTALNLTFPPGMLGAILYLVVAAVVLMLSDRFLKGMEVKGFVGAIVAAIAIGFVYWIVIWLFGLLNIEIPLLF